VTGWVIDASVAVKWFIREEHSEAAVRFLKREDRLSAPDVLLPEVANAVWKKVARREITRLHGQGIVQALIRSPIRMHSSAPLLDLAFRLAAHVDATVYDSLYVSLAIAEHSTLVTFDRRLLRKFQGVPGARVFSIEELV